MIRKVHINKITIFISGITVSGIHIERIVLWISLPFEHCVFCYHAFSIIGKKFLCVKLRENYTAPSPEVVWALCVSLIFVQHSLHENPWNMQCSNGSEICSRKWLIVSCHAGAQNNKKSKGTK